MPGPHPHVFAINLSATAVSAFSTLARNDYVALHRAVGALCETQGAHPQARAVDGGAWRLDVGDWVLLYEVDPAARVVLVQDVAQR